jgi:hypothetical protein
MEITDIISPDVLELIDTINDIDKNRKVVFNFKKNKLIIKTDNDIVIKINNILLKIGEYCNFEKVDFKIKTNKVIIYDFVY